MGFTGRMGTNQHLMRSIVEIINQGGVKVNEAEVIMPDPVLVGRNTAKLEHLKSISGVEKITTDLDSVLSDPYYQVYFDSQNLPEEGHLPLKRPLRQENIFTAKNPLGYLPKRYWSYTNYVNRKT